MPTGYRLRPARRLMVLVSALLLMLLSTVPATAAPAPLPPGGVVPRVDANTDLVMTGTGPGQGVAGSIGPADGSFDPLAGYPDAIPDGFTRRDQGFSGLITARSVESGQSLNMFCIDILTSTYPGIGYENGTWDESNVPNVGYIARILSEYYPNTGEPADAPSVNIRAAAVQAAIWFFSDS